MTTIPHDGSTRHADDGRGLNLSRREVVKGAGALAVGAAVGPTATVAGRAARAQAPGEVGHVTTSDGVSLSYLEAGSGKPILMIPGWSQTAEQFKHQLAGLSDRYRVIAVDMRGHGESDKPDFGYKISRLAKDTYDLIHALDLEEVNILGHSMGSSVIWNYYDLFGPERLSKLLLIDQMPMITSNPTWPEEERINSGAIFNPQSLYETINALAGPDGVETTRGFIGNMVTKAIPEADKAWIIERNLRMPREHAATLLYNHSTQDWRDLIPRITLPSLVVGGRVSVVPWQSQAWVAEQIPDARLEIFEEEDGGNHFMFIEGHEKFNAIVADFVG
jgi:pimeloyl-ACP methyl ester carboxylesterase